MDNPIMYNHDLEKLDNIHPDFPVESKCDLHLKLIEYFCITCKLQICSTCAINGHRLHDTQTLEEYVRIIIFYNFNILLCLTYYEESIVNESYYSYSTWFGLLSYTFYKYLNLLC